MQDRPPAAELLEALAAFLEGEFGGELGGRKRFLLRVAANVAGIVAREIERGPGLLSEQLVSLAGLLDRDIEVPAGHGARLELFEELSGELSRRIAGGEADAEPWRSAVLAYLRSNVAAKLAVDNPGYDAKPRG